MYVQGQRTRQLIRKVPEITIYFWIIKLLTTAMGESTSDYLVNRFNPYIVVILGFFGFILVMALQFRVRRYIAWLYWLAVVAVAIFGTMAADVTYVALGVPYVISTIVFGLALAVIFVLWQKTEKTLSIHSIVTTRREVFYWATVLATFALGTAAGDFAAYTAGLGFLSAGIVFAIVFAIPAIGYWLFKWNAIFAFWFAYIMTRPLGASFADWTGKAHSFGGLGLGDGLVGGTLAILIIIFVGYLSFTHKDIKSRAGG
ncbi:MAG: COG4705 family protein [Candidatus Saccharimonadales bacterium]